MIISTIAITIVIITFTIINIITISLLLQLKKRSPAVIFWRVLQDFILMNEKKIRVISRGIPSSATHVPLVLPFSEYTFFSLSLSMHIPLFVCSSFVFPLHGVYRCFPAWHSSIAIRQLLVTPLVNSHCICYLLVAVHNEGLFFVRFSWFLIMLLLFLFYFHLYFFSLSLCYLLSSFFSFFLYLLLHFLLIFALIFPVSLFSIRHRLESRPLRCPGLVPMSILGTWHPPSLQRHPFASYKSPSGRRRRPGLPRSDPTLPAVPSPRP